MVGGQPERPSPPPVMRALLLSGLESAVPAAPGHPVRAGQCPQRGGGQLGGEGIDDVQIEGDAAP